MQKLILSIGIGLLLLSNTPTHAQTTLYEQDFESPAVTDIVNTGQDTLRTGSSWCTEATRGKVATHNSDSVDFRSDQNDSYFVALNPQDSCGGFNTATLESNTFDFSAADSLYFSCRYFISEPFGWGTGTAEFTFDNGTSTFNIDTQFSDEGRWANVLVQLPDTMIHDSVTFTIDLGGGRGVGFDDIKITNYPADTSDDGGGTNISIPTHPAMSIYPNPAREKLFIEAPEMLSGTVSLYNMKGELKQRQPLNETITGMSVESLSPGLYVVVLESEETAPVYRKVIIK
jgi:hypothetical protein